MCTVSSKLKLCTCSAAGKSRLKNYWVWFRPEGKHIQTIGEVLLPANFDPDLTKQNLVRLLQRLNEPDAFDVNLVARQGDRLLLHFDTKSGRNGMKFGFEYTGGQWEECDYNYFLWPNVLAEMDKGSLKPALEE